MADDDCITLAYIELDRQGSGNDDKPRPYPQITLHTHPPIIDTAERDGTEELFEKISPDDLETIEEMTMSGVIDAEYFWISGKLDDELVLYRCAVASFQAFQTERFRPRVPENGPPSTYYTIPSLGEQRGQEPPSCVTETSVFEWPRRHTKWIAFLCVLVAVVLLSAMAVGLVITKTTTATTMTTTATTTTTKRAGRTTTAITTTAGGERIVEIKTRIPFLVSDYGDERSSERHELIKSIDKEVGHLRYL